MSLLRRYISNIVEPTIAEFTASASARHCFIACVVTFHAIDRAESRKGERRKLLEDWRRRCPEFRLVEAACLHHKHLSAAAPDDRSIGLPISFALGFSQDPEAIDVRNMWFVLRDVVSFLKAEADRLTTE